MDKDTIRHLMGHGPNSRVMETTYRHLDDDHIKDAEVSMGLREPEEEGASLTPPACFECDEPLQPSWDLCPACGYVYGPDAQQAREVVSDSMKDAYAEADPDDEQAQDDLDTLDDLLDNPAIEQKLLDRLEDRLSDRLDGYRSSAASPLSP